MALDSTVRDLYGIDYTIHDNAADRVIRRGMANKESTMNIRSMIARRNSILVPAIAGALTLLASPPAARAAGGGGGGAALPWEGPLNQVLASFTGPVAHPRHGRRVLNA